MRSHIFGAMRHGLVVAVAAGVLVVGCADSGGGVAVPGTSPEESPQEAPMPSPSIPGEGTPEVFVPATRMEDGVVVLPITFPDGSTAELAYPPSLDIAGMGAEPYWVGCGGDFNFHHYDPYGIVYDGEPLETYTGADGQPVSLWRGAKGTGGIDYLIFHFGPWTVDAYEYRGGNAAAVVDRKDCAEGLTGTVTDDGWIVLDGPESVALPSGVHGPPEGAEVQFGGLSPRSFILMWPGPCNNDPSPDSTEIDGLHVDLHRDFASWCNQQARMRIHVYFKPGSDLFRQVFEQVEVRNVVTPGS